MDFNKKYEQETRENKLDDQFISDLAEKMARRRAEVLASESDGDTENVTIIKHDSRKIYISRAAAVAGIIMALIGTAYFGRFDRTGEITDPDGDSMIAQEGFAETTAVTEVVSGSITSVISSAKNVISDKGEKITSVFTAPQIYAEKTEKASVHFTEASEENVSDTEAAQQEIYHSRDEVPAVTSVVSHTQSVPVTTSSAAPVVTSLTTEVSALQTVCSSLPDAGTEAPVTMAPQAEETQAVSSETMHKGPVNGEPVFLSSASASAAPGDTVRVSIKIESGTDIISGFVLYTSYSNDAFEILSVSVPTTRESSDLSVKKKDGRLYVMYLNPNAVNHKFDPDNFINIDIKVRDHAKPGVYTIIPHSVYGIESYANSIDEEKNVIAHQLDYSGFELTVK